MQIDSAFQRRLDYKCYVPPPKFEDREPLLKSFVGPYNTISDDQWSQLVRETEHMTISGLKSHVQSVKDKLEQKISSASHFVFANMPEGPPKWVPCRPHVPGAVKRNDDVHFSNIAKPKIRFKDLSHQSANLSRDETFYTSYRRRMKLTKQEHNKRKGVQDEEGTYPESMYHEYMKQYKCYS